MPSAHHLEALPASHTRLIHGPMLEPPMLRKLFIARKASLQLMLPLCALFSLPRTLRSHLRSCL